MTKHREVEYARSSDGIDIAYKVIGDGPVDLVYVPGFVTHLDLEWGLPHFAWLEQLDGIARVITFDKRGTGLSDRTLGFGSVEERAEDIRVVMDAAGSNSAFIHGVSEGGPMAIVFAASFPERVRGLILYATMARMLRGPGYEVGMPEEIRGPFLQFVADRWGTGEVFSTLIQHAPDPVATGRLLARFERSACTPKMAVEIMQRNFEIDVRATLGAVQAPTLVLHAQGDPAIPSRLGRYLAEHITNATFTALEGAFHGSWLPELRDVWRRHLVEFLSLHGASPVRADRALATIVFTDIVGSTETASRVGDSSWSTLLEAHDRIMTAYVDRFGGRFVKTTGDGVLATFDGPGRGIGFASGVRQALRPIGLGVRAGVHTGEVELRDDDITGIAVVIARRICDLAGAGDVLVSRTVKDLVAGSRTSFTDRGRHRLKGVPDEWELFEVADGDV